MNLGISRTIIAAVALGALGLNALPAAAADSSTPVDSARVVVTDDSAYGAYLWHNDDGWHFRTHGSVGGTHFTARIATNGTLRDVIAVRDEADDHIQLNDDGRALEISFVTSTGVDGVDFRLDDAAWLRLKIDANEQPLPVDSIFLGDDGRHPEKNPFALRLRELRVPEDLRSGYTLLHESDRLMLLTHDLSGSTSYTGTLTTTGRIEVLDLVQPEKDDSVNLSADGSTLTFKFSTQEGVDGVVIRVTGAEKLQLSLDTNAQLTPVSAIHLNRRGESPKTNPFDVRV